MAYRHQWPKNICFTTKSLYTRVSLSELVPLSRPPLCDSLSERTPYRNVLLIGTYSLSEQFVTYSLSEQLFAIRYRNVLLIGTNCSDKEYCQPYSLSEQFVPIRSTAGRTPYPNKLFKKRAPASVA